MDEGASVQLAQTSAGVDKGIQRMRMGRVADANQGMGASTRGMAAAMTAAAAGSPPICYFVQ